MDLPPSENPFHRDELTDVEVKLEASVVERLRQGVKKRDISFGQMVRYALDVGLQRIPVPDDDEATGETSAGPSPSDDGDDRSRTSVLEQFRDAVERIDDLERRRETAKQDVSPLIQQLLDDISREAGASEPDRKADAPATERSALTAGSTDADDTTVEDPSADDPSVGDRDMGHPDSEGEESETEESKGIASEDADSEDTHDPPSMFDLADDP
jgi:hypothetical protein